LISSPDETFSVSSGVISEKSLKTYLFDVTFTYLDDPDYLPITPIDLDLECIPRFRRVA